MSGVRRSFRVAVPLPRRWPSALKTAILHTFALATFVLTRTRAWCANRPIARVQLRAEVDRLRSEVGMLREEIRIKDARMARVPPARRPHYAPIDRLALLELRAARGWSLAQTARVFLLADATIASWTRRLDEEGEEALVKTPTPVNTYPDFVRHIVKRLKLIARAMGRRRIADTLARAGLHLGATTVRRWLHNPGGPVPGPPSSAKTDRASRAEPTVHRSVKARYPHHVWHVDLTVVPTLAGFWVPWLCQALPSSWPFGWRLLVVLDHFSRVVVGYEVFAHEPSAVDVCAALDRLVTQSRASPKYIVTDRGAQFQRDYRAWCGRHGVRPRFGAVGQHGSIAVIERFIRTLKSEGLRRVLTPLTIRAMHAEVDVFCRWYGRHRPHSSLRGATPKEMYDGRRPARTRPRLEPRARYPIGGTLGGKRGDRIEVQVTPLEGREHLPVVRLRRLNPRRAA